MTGLVRQTLLTNTGLRTGASLLISNSLLNGAPFTPQTTALINAMTTKPSSARAQLINNTIILLQAYGLWNTYSVLYMLDAESEQASRLNWINPSIRTLTAVNSPEFIQNVGWKGDGVGAYLSLGVGASTFSKYTLNNCRVGVRVVAGPSGEDASVVGTLTGASMFSRPRTSSGSWRTRLNDATSVDTTVGDITGDILWSRASSSGYTKYKNAVAVATAAAVSTSVTSGILILLGHNLPAEFSTCTLADARWGSGVTASQAVLEYQVLTAYHEQTGAI